MVPRPKTIIPELYTVEEQCPSSEASAIKEAKETSPNADSSVFFPGELTRGIYDNNEPRDAIEKLYKVN